MVCLGGVLNFLVKKALSSLEVMLHYRNESVANHAFIEQEQLYCRIVLIVDQVHEKVVLLLRVDNLICETRLIFLILVHLGKGLQCLLSGLFLLFLAGGHISSKKLYQLLPHLLLGFWTYTRTWRVWVRLGRTLLLLWWGILLLCFILSFWAWSLFLIGLLFNSSLSLLRQHLKRIYRLLLLLLLLIVSYNSRKSCRSWNSIEDWVSAQTLELRILAHKHGTLNANSRTCGSGRLYFLSQLPTINQLLVLDARYPLIKLFLVILSSLLAQS